MAISKIAKAAMKERQVLRKRAYIQLLANRAFLKCIAQNNDDCDDSRLASHYSNSLELHLKMREKGCCRNNAEGERLYEDLMLFINMRETNSNGTVTEASRRSIDEILTMPAPTIPIFVGQNKPQRSILLHDESDPLDNDALADYIFRSLSETSPVFTGINFKTALSHANVHVLEEICKLREDCHNRFQLAHAAHEFLPLDTSELPELEISDEPLKDFIKICEKLGLSFNVPFQDLNEFQLPNELASSTTATEMSVNALEGDPFLLPLTKLIMTKDDIPKPIDIIKNIAYSVIAQASRDKKRRVFAGVHGGIAKCYVNKTDEGQKYLLAERHFRSEYEHINYDQILYIIPRELAEIIEKLVNMILQYLGLTLSFNDPSVPPCSFGDYRGLLIVYMTTLKSHDVYSSFANRSTPLIDLNPTIILCHLRNIVTNEYDFDFPCLHTNTFINIPHHRHVLKHTPSRSESHPSAEYAQSLPIIKGTLQKYATTYGSNVGLDIEDLGEWIANLSAVFKQFSFIGYGFRGCGIFRNKVEFLAKHIRYYNNIHTFMSQEFRSLNEDYLDIIDFKPRLCRYLEAMKEEGLLEYRRITEEDSEDSDGDSDE